MKLRREEEKICGQRETIHSTVINIIQVLLNKIRHTQTVISDVSQLETLKV